MKYDLLIVGGGIAGCTAAWYALQKKKSVLWYDLPQQNVSSSVAAGMVNPIVLRRFTKSWMADTLLPFARSFYQNLDHELTTTTFHEVPIYRVFASQDEKNLWLRIMAKEYFQQYMALPEEKPKESHINDTFGYGQIKGGGYLDVNQFMKAFKKFFNEQRGTYVEEAFDFKALNTQAGAYKNYSFQNILFCEGQHMYKNPFFNHLPYRRTKGEVLRFKTEEINLQNGIFSRGIFCLPLEKKLYKIGATFSHDDFTTQPTEAGKEELTSKLKKLFRGDYTITQHYAGIRPTVKDRRPLLGQHPEEKNIYIFNGLGTKGVLLAPYFANAIINCIFEKKDLPKEVDIKRFNNTYD